MKENPQTWESVPLRACAKWYSGGTPRKSNAAFWGGTIPWISAKSLNRFYIEESDTCVTQLGAMNGTRLVPPNSVLFIVRGMSLKTEFRMGITKRAVTFNQDLKALVAEEGIEPLYLAYALRAATPQILDLVDEAGHGTGRLQTDLLEGLEIPMPPLDEQRRIAAVLGAHDDKIELNRKMNQTLEEMAQAIFKSWFIDFDGVPEEDLVDSELGPIPRGWRIQSLADLIEIIGGGTPKSSIESYWGGGIPWFSVRDAPSASDLFVWTTERTITSEGLASSSARLVPAWTTIVSARGTVGKFAITPFEMTFNQSCYGVRPIDGHGELFVHYLLRSALVRLQQRAHGSVFDTITRGTFESIRVVEPPRALSLAFHERVRPLLERIRLNGAQSLTLTSIRDALLPKLISGEIRVPAAAKIVEEHA